MSELQLWKSSDPFMEMLDYIFDTPRLIDRGFNYRKCNIEASDKDYRIQLSVPGLTKEDIKIGIQNSIITISHEKQETDNKSYSFTNSFQRQYSLPDDVDEDNISGKVENGVLEIVVPRLKKKSNERFIEIN